MTSSDSEPETTSIHQGEPTYAREADDQIAQRSRVRAERNEERRSPSAAEDGVPARTHDLGGQADPVGNPDDPGNGL